MVEAEGELRPTLPDPPPPSSRLGWVMLGVVLGVTALGGLGIVVVLERRVEELEAGAATSEVSAVGSGSAPPRRPPIHRTRGSVTGERSVSPTKH